GTVNSVTEITSPVAHDGKTPPMSQGRVTRMTVDEYFKGSGGAEIDLIGGNTSCDICFEPGKRCAAISGIPAVLAAIVWFLDLGLRRLRILKRVEGVSYRFYFSVAWVIVNGLVLYGRA